MTSLICSASSRCETIHARGVTSLPEVFAYDLRVVRSIAWAGYTLLLYDYILTLRDEATYIWPTRWSIVKSIYMFNRYGNLLGLAILCAHINGFLYLNTKSFCARATMGTGISMYVSLTSIHVLILLRAWAVWARARKILMTLICMFVLYFVASSSLLIWEMLQLTDEAFPLADVTHTCIAFVSRSSWVLWLPGLALECSMLTVTMWKLPQFRQGIHIMSPLARTLYRDGVIYFICALFCNLFVTIVWARDGQTPLIMLWNVFGVAIINVAGQRLVLDLRRVHQHELSSTDIHEIVNFGVIDLDLTSRPDLSETTTPEVRASRRTVRSSRWAFGRQEAGISGTMEMHPIAGRGRGRGRNADDVSFSIGTRGEVDR